MRHRFLTTGVTFLAGALLTGPCGLAVGVLAQTSAPARDLMIKTRQTFDRPRSTVTVTTIFLKGARQRTELLWEFPEGVGNQRTAASASIAQCDQRRRIMINPDTRLFGIEPIPSRASDATRREWLMKQARGTPVPLGPEVVITIDGVDTNERKDVGGYPARHIITTTTTVPSAEATTHASKRVEDGWYIDLPSVNCEEPNGQSSRLVGGFTSVMQPGRPPDRLRVEYHGVAASGFALERVVQYSDGSDGMSYTETTTLVDVSRSELDAALFDVPAGYQAALPRVTGGFDLTKADSIGNRLSDYWTFVTSRAQSLVRAWTPRSR
jgi:hypothetical protein